MRAGDLAPQIVWTRVLGSPEATESDLRNYPGHVTVVAFFPNISANPKLVSRWNELVAQFADQPVTFVWITSEQSAELDSALNAQPVNGWLLLDAEWETAGAFGVEMAGGALIDASGRIAGFTVMIPNEQQIRAVQEGRALALTGDADDEQLDAVLAGRAVRLDAEPHRWRHPDPKPDIPPSYDVHISSSNTNGTIGSEGPDRYVQRGFELREMISKVYKRDPSRIVLPSALDNGERYDIVLVPPQEMDHEAMYGLLRRGIEQHFQLVTSIERREMDVYVMTAVEGKIPEAKTGTESFGGGFISSSSLMSHPRPHGDRPLTAAMIREMVSALPLSFGGISNISAHNTSMDDFRRALEQGLHRPIVDETNMAGTYDLAVQGDARSDEEFFRALQDQTGLVLTPARRHIEMLVIHRP